MIIRVCKVFSELELDFGQEDPAKFASILF